MVVCGDFFQLPPVGNHFYKDSGTIVLKAVCGLTFKHTVNLDVIIRQSEPKFCKNQSSKRDSSREHYS